MALTPPPIRNPGGATGTTPTGNAGGNPRGTTSGSVLLLPLRVTTIFFLHFLVNISCCSIYRLVTLDSFDTLYHNIAQRKRQGLGN
jgi:hypothetical protein